MFGLPNFGSCSLELYNDIVLNSVVVTALFIIIQNIWALPSHG